MLLDDERGARKAMPLFYISIDHMDMDDFTFLLTLVDQQRAPEEDVER